MIWLIVVVNFFIFDEIKVFVFGIFLFDVLNCCNIWLVVVIGLIKVIIIYKLIKYIISEKNSKVRIFLVWMKGGCLMWWLILNNILELLL